MRSPLDTETTKQLLRLAREAIRAQAKGLRFEASELPSPPEASGVFVTIHVAGALRGCIGFLDLASGLSSGVAEAARRAASSDPRFPPIDADELDDMTIDVTLLGPLEQITDATDFVIGRHGLVIECQGRRGLLLPQVAVEHRWDQPAFLSALCQKAWLPDRSWEETEAKLFRFEGTVLRDGE